MKRVSIAVLVVVLLSIQHGVRAEPVVGALMTVDEVTVTTAGFRVTGVVQGESSPSSWSFVFTSLYGTDADRAAARENCGRLLLLAMSKPGQYLFRVRGNEECAVRLATP